MQQQGLGALGRRNRSPRAVQALAVGAAALIGLVAAACNNSAAPTSSTATTAPPSVNTLISEGQAAQNAGDPSQAKTFYTQAVAQAPTNPTALYDLGDVEQVDLNDPTDAETNYQKALAVAPDFENALFNVAIILTTSNPTQAEADYRKIISLDPKGSASSHLNLGFLLRQQGHIAAGNAELRAAVALEPSLESRVAGVLGTTGATGAS